MKRSLLPLLFCVAVLGVRAIGQDNPVSLAPPSFLPDPFYKNFNISLPLYNGRVFDSYPALIKGKALIPEDRWAPVTVLYDGLWFKTTGRYDRYADELVIRNPDSTCLFILNRDRVSRFLLGDRMFVKLDTASLSGFYEMIADGPFAVFIKRSMLLNEDISGTVVEKEFVAQQFYYVRKNGEFHQIRNKSNLYALIKEKKSEITRALRTEKIKYRKDPETTIKIAARFYK